MATITEMLEILSEYRAVRLKLLNLLGCAHSNRDPLSELSERLVAAQVCGKLADSRVQNGYDVVGPKGDKIQVKYLANPADAWINGHPVMFTSDMDQYAVVFFENLRRFRNTGRMN